MQSNWTNEYGIKRDTGKPPMALLDRYALEQIAQVLGFGASKYERDNWRKGIRYTRLVDAMLRHAFAIADGEDIDPESGLPHAAHIGCCTMFLLWMMRFRPDLDDRYKVDQALSAIEHEITQAMKDPAPRSSDMMDVVDAHD